MVPTADIRRLAAEAAPGTIELRRDLHRHPELGWTERRTTYELARRLRELGLDPEVRDDGVGLVVDVGPAPPRVGFRADLDALPIEEANDVPYRSRNEGVMHACGHDAHAAIGVGIAEVLVRLGSLPAGVRFVFQPAEELLPGGAVTLVAEGVHEGLEALVAFHVDPSLEPGLVGTRVGPITAASDKFTIHLHGPGGHTSRPHQTVDLHHVAARVVLDLPTRLRARLDPLRTVVPVFGRVAGGTAPNVIPTRVELAGTMRTVDPETWQELPKLTAELVDEIVAPFGARAELDYVQGSPPVVNDAAVVAAVEAAVAALYGPEAIRTTHQSLGSEDFAWYLEDVPGAMLRLGVAREGPPVDLHSATFDLDESALEVGVAVGAAALLELIARR